MRVSTQMIYDSGVSTLQKRTSEALKLQQQLATNKRMLTPSDDPVAAAQALEVTQAKSLNDQYAKNQAYANDTLALTEGQLQSAEDLLQRVYELTVQIGNSTLSDTDRESVTTEMRQRFDELVGIANQQDGLGNYLFSGFRGDTKPFVGSIDSGVSYQGDEGQRLLRVSPSRDLRVSESGRDLFMGVVDKSTPFSIESSSLNTGTGTISEPKISDPTKWNSVLNPKSFTIHFAYDGTDTTYDIVDDTGISLLTNSSSAVASPPVVPPLPGTYVQGAPIELKALSSTVGGMDFGASVVIENSPANGDSFTIRPASPVSVFDTISNLVQAAEQPLDGMNEATRAGFRAQVDAALGNLLSSQDNILRYRSDMGARMSELDSLGSAASQRDLDYTATLSRLEDVDMTAAISNLNQTQITLQAAQLSFTKISQLSLFNYL
mgnify:CR=1 FL=1